MHESLHAHVYLLESPMKDARQAYTRKEGEKKGEKKGRFPSLSELMLFVCLFVCLFVFLCAWREDSCQPNTYFLHVP